MRVISFQLHPRLKASVIFQPKHSRFLIDGVEVINDDRTFESDFEGKIREVFMVPVEDPETGETDI
ncbi:MAG: hypothetical protein EB168_10920, partial [Euryarchaeota archaeon]|nr:hypothetical protein [Euryarchaeota archaeon]